MGSCIILSGIWINLLEGEEGELGESVGEAGDECEEGVVGAEHVREGILISSAEGLVL